MQIGAIASVKMGLNLKALINLKCIIEEKALVTPPVGEYPIDPNP